MDRGAKLAAAINAGQFNIDARVIVSYDDWDHLTSWMQQMGGEYALDLNWCTGLGYVCWPPHYIQRIHLGLETNLRVEVAEYEDAAGFF